MADAPAPAARAANRWFVIGAPYLWLLVFFLAPFVVVLKISLSDTTIAQPPYVPVLDLANGWQGVTDWWDGLDLENYKKLFEDELYFASYVSSLVIATVATLFSLLIAYPMAYGMARAPKSMRPTLLMLVILPFWTSLLIRVYAWIGILDREGLLNAFLQGIGVIDEPLVIMNTNTAVFIGIVYSYLPFMVLPLYSSLEKLDDALLEAAADLGSPPWKAFWQITVPLSLPGVIAGCFLVFIPAVGEFVIPDLLGGSDTLMIGKTLNDEFFLIRDWPSASAIAVLMLLVLVVPIAIYQNVQARELEGSR
jgi:putrescine transport system permease protein